MVYIIVSQNKHDLNNTMQFKTKKSLLIITKTIIIITIVRENQGGGGKHKGTNQITSLESLFSNWPHTAKIFAIVSVDLLISATISFCFTLLSLVT